jgi:hypothetical protein
MKGKEKKKSCWIRWKLVTCDHQYHYLFLLWFFSFMNFVPSCDNKVKVNM